MRNNYTPKTEQQYFKDLEEAEIKKHPGLQVSDEIQKRMKELGIGPSDTAVFYKEEYIPRIHKISKSK